MTKPSNFSKLPAFLISFIYKLTVQLAIEFLKILALVAILVSTCALFGLGFVSLVVWAYVTYDNSIVAAVTAVVIGLALLVTAFLAIEYLVKDVLCLTDIRLIYLIKVFLVSLVCNSVKAKTNSSSDVAKKECGQEDERVSRI